MPHYSIIKRFFLFLFVLLAGACAGFFMFNRDAVRVPAGAFYVATPDRDTVERAFSGHMDSKKIPTPPMVIVPHHLLAARSIGEILAPLASDAQQTVLLISPNHFNRGAGLAITSNEPWNTAFGTVFPDGEKVEHLVATTLFTNEWSPIRRDHGITNILPFIKKVLPNARIVPLMVKDRATVEEARKIATVLKEHLPQDTIVIGSFDFSHYLPAYAANFDDLRTENVLRYLDMERSSGLDSDSVPGLRIIMSLAREYGYETFMPLHHSNSGEMLQDEHNMETTSHFTGYFTRESYNAPVATILALGESVKPPTTYNPDNGFNRFLRGSDIFLTATEKPQGLEIKKVRGLRIGIFHASVNTALSTVAPVISSARKQAEAVLVVLHGEATLPQVRDVAHEFINSGADTVLASISDVSQPLEIYKGKPIFYSVGSFSAQYTTDRRISALGIGIAAAKNQMSYTLLPLRYADGEVSLTTFASRRTILESIAKSSRLSSEYQNAIKNGILTFSIYAQAQ